MNECTVFFLLSERNYNYFQRDARKLRSSVVFLKSDYICFGRKLIFFDSLSSQLIRLYVVVYRNESSTITTRTRQTDKERQRDRARERRQCNNATRTCM